MKRGNAQKPFYDSTNNVAKVREDVESKLTTSNQIQVYGIGDICSLPDQAKISITISSSKSKVDDSKNSVKRRYDYVIQCICNQHLKNSDVTESSCMKKHDGAYNYSTTIFVTFTDFRKCRELCNLLEEKLDNSVVVSSPVFSNTKQHLDQLRRKASVLAVENARTKAVEIANHVGNRLLRPIWLREEEFSETVGQSATAYNPDDLCREPSGAMVDQWERSMDISAISVHAKVVACFEMGSLRTGDR